MQAQSVLLEPWYDFRLELPQSQVGRAMTDLQRMGAQLDPPEAHGEGSVLTGSAPAAAFGDYAQEVAAYTRGLGRLSCALKGYAPCADQARVVAELGYDPEGDTDNTPDSVFCSGGAGRTVKWSEVFDHMHLPSTLQPPQEPTVEERAQRYFSHLASDTELMAIFERTYGPVKDRLTALRPAAKKKPSADRPHTAARPVGPELVLVDGYNIIFAWEDLRLLAQTSLDAARARLIERLRNYQGWRDCPVILVFDAYKVKGYPGSVEQLGGVSVVYTKEAETADMYIEKTAHDLSKHYRVRVATSDALEQVIILGGGALRVPASAFEQEVKEVESAIRGFLQG
jgi:predicted RNA-binding protein with PIN domain